MPKKGTNHPKKTPSKGQKRPSEPLENGGSYPPSHQEKFHEPVTITPTGVEVDSKYFHKMVSLIAPLAKSANPTDKFHIARFTEKELCASDRNTGMRVPFPGLSEVNVAIDHLAHAAAACEKSDIVTVIDVDRQEYRMDIRAGNYQVSLALSVDPGIPAIPPTPEQWTPLPETAWQAIEDVSYATNTNPNNSITLNCVLLRYGVALAGDGIWLAVKRTGLDIKFTTLVYDQLFKATSKREILPTAIGITEDRTWLRFDDGVIYWGILPSAAWPSVIDSAVKENMEKIKDRPPDILYFPKNMKAAIQRVDMFPGKHVSVTTDQDLVIFTTKGEGGEATESIEATCDPGLIFNANPKLLAEVIGRTMELYFVKPGILVLRSNTGLTALLGAIR